MALLKCHVCDDDDGNGDDGHYDCFVPTPATHTRTSHYQCTHLTHYCYLMSPPVYIFTWTPAFFLFCFTLLWFGFVSSVLSVGGTS